MAKLIDPEVELMQNVGRMLKNNSRCRNCKYFIRKDKTCEAFPDGVPIPFLTGQMIHNKKMFKQKNEIVFKKI